MSIPLSELRDNSPAELRVGVPTKIRIAGVRVQHPRSGADVELDGPVDFAAWDSCTFELTDSETHESKVVPGLCIRLSEIDGQPTDKRLNVVARRLIEQLKPFLASGAYQGLRFTITKNGPGKSATFSVVPEPV